MLTTIPGTTFILVTASDKTTSLTYEVRYTTEDLSNNASLSDLKVDGETITGFNADTLNYVVELPFGTSTIPAISAVVEDTTATIEIKQAQLLPGTATVEVTAQDQATSLIYTVEFTIAKPSTDATLSAIAVNGELLANFNSDTLIYNFELPNGTTEIPVVDATVNDIKATKLLTQATDLPGSATIRVTAEDNETTLIYTINFLFEDNYISFKVSHMNEPLVGASVTFDDETELTDEMGIASFPLIVSGVQNYSVTKQGYVGIQSSVDVSTIDTVEVELMLVGINDLDQSAFNLYPNPTKGKFIVSCTYIDENTNILVLSSEGKVIERRTLNKLSNEIDLSTNESGIYFVKVVNNKQSKTMKIILNK